MSRKNVTKDTDIAHVFDDYFASVGVESNHHAPPFPNRNVPQLNYFTMTCRMLLMLSRIISLLVLIDYHHYFSSGLKIP